MQKIASIGLVVFGFVIGSDRFLHAITGFLATNDFPIDISVILREVLYLGFIVAGILGYQNKSAAKYIALVSVITWLYFHFMMLSWPLAQPGFFGETGWSAWKRSIDVVSVGVVHGSALLWATFILFKFNKSSQQDASKAGATA